MIKHLREKLNDLVLLMVSTVIVLAIAGILYGLHHIGNGTNNLIKHRTNYEWIQTRR